MAKVSWTSWGRRFVLVLSLVAFIPMSIVGMLAGYQDGVRSIFVLGCGALIFYSLLLIRQLSAKVGLNENGVFQSTVFSSSFIEYSEIKGVGSEAWDGDYYMLGSWPMKIDVPVLILHSGDKKYLRRAFGPPSHVYKVLNEISVKAGLGAVPVPHTRSRRKLKGQEKYVPKRAARKERA